MPKPITMKNQSTFTSQAYLIFTDPVKKELFI
ncbi:hypothetical protein BH11BAC3_BH11BAC3_33560 [soil metagenome]